MHTLVYIIIYGTTVLCSREQKGVGVAHKATPKHQHQFSQTMMGKVHGVNQSPNKLYINSKLLQQITIIFFCLTEFSNE